MKKKYLSVRGLNYGPPVKTMRNYLEGMKAAPYMALSHEEEPPTVIAALGPKMLELASEMTQGAHPYFTSPEHTAMAREKLGKEQSNNRFLLGLCRWLKG